MTLEFDLAIVKLTAYCNLNCSYCYMFNQADKTHLRVPKAMEVDTGLRLLDRIVEHLDATGRKRFTVTFHGGEPLLWPDRSFEVFLSRVAQLRAQGYELKLVAQTNGLRLPGRLLDRFSEHNVTLGISIDGPAVHNDAVRVGFDGRGSYARVMRAVQKLLASPNAHLLQGFLCVANPAIHPETFLSWAASLPVRRLDVLWPLEFHHDNPPWGGGDPAAYGRAPTYGTWFADLFEAWWRRDEPGLVIRFFYDTLMAMLGSASHVENIVNDRVPMFVVNTDGGLEYHDYFRSYRDGGTRTRFNVKEHSLADLGTDAGFQWFATLRSHLPPACRGCSFESICGGGFLPGRAARAKTLPDDRSVLCADQYHYFRRVQALVAPEVNTSPEPSPAASRVRWSDSEIPLTPPAWVSGRTPRRRTTLMP